MCDHTVWPGPSLLNDSLLLYRCYPVSILYKSIADRYRPVTVGDGPITVRYRFIKNASWVDALNRCFNSQCHGNRSRRHFKIFLTITEKISFDISCNSYEMISLIFAEKVSEKKIDCHLLQICLAL